MKNETTMTPERIREAIAVYSEEPAMRDYYEHAPAGARLFIALVFYCSLFADEVNERDYEAYRLSVENELTPADLDYLIRHEHDAALRAHFERLAGRISEESPVRHMRILSLLVGLIGLGVVIGTCVAMKRHLWPEEVTCTPESVVSNEIPARAISPKPVSQNMTHTGATLTNVAPDRGASEKSVPKKEPSVKVAPVKAVSADAKAKKAWNGGTTDRKRLREDLRRAADKLAKERFPVPPSHTDLDPSRLFVGGMENVLPPTDRLASHVTFTVRIRLWTGERIDGGEVTFGKRLPREFFSERVRAHIGARRARGAYVEDAAVENALNGAYVVFSVVFK